MFKEVRLDYVVCVALEEIFDEEFWYIFYRVELMFNDLNIAWTGYGDEWTYITKGGLSLRQKRYQMLNALLKEK